MKIVEIAGGKLQLPINNEEADLLTRFHENYLVLKQDLNEREVYIANQLVNKDVLIRKNNDGKISYFKQIKENSKDSSASSSKNN